MRRNRASKPSRTSGGFSRTKTSSLRLSSCCQQRCRQRDSAPPHDTQRCSVNAKQPSIFSLTSVLDASPENHNQRGCILESASFEGPGQPSPFLEAAAFAPEKAHETDHMEICVQAGKLTIRGPAGFSDELQDSLERFLRVGHRQAIP